MQHPVLVCIHQYYGLCSPEYHTHTNCHFHLELSLMRIISVRLTCTTEPNLSGSKRSQCINVFMHTPGISLKLSLHLKKTHTHTKLLTGLGKNPRFMLNITYCVIYIIYDTLHCWCILVLLFPYSSLS